MLRYYRYNIDTTNYKGYKRNNEYKQGKEYFKKTFEKKDNAERYLKACKVNAKYPFYANIKEDNKNNNKTYTLHLYKAYLFME